MSNSLLKKPPEPNVQIDIAKAQEDIKTKDIL